MARRWGSQFSIIRRTLDTLPGGMPADTGCLPLTYSACTISSTTTARTAASPLRLVHPCTSVTACSSMPETRAVQTSLNSTRSIPIAEVLDPVHLDQHL